MQSDKTFSYIKMQVEGTDKKSKLQMPSYIDNLTEFFNSNYLNDQFIKVKKMVDNASKSAKILVIKEESPIKKKIYVARRDYSKDPRN